ncbi:MAG: hypothetical protein AB3N18_02375 [Allomuricauda sp.]
MKILSKIYSNINIAFMATVLIAGAFLTSCEDDDKNQLNDFLETGGFVRFVGQNPPGAVGVNEISELSYSFSVEDPNGTAAMYDLRLYADLAGVRTDTVQVEQVTTLPASFSFNAEDIASLLGVTVDDLGFGDNFFFTASVTTTDGTVYGGADRLNFLQVFPQPDGTYLDEDDDPVDVGPNDVIYTTADGDTFLAGGQNNTDDLLDEAGYRQAFEFGFVILCPTVDFALLPGTYDVTNLGFAGFFGETDFVREVVAGPGANQITIIDGEWPSAGSQDLVLDIDPTTGAVSLGEVAIAFDAAAGAFATDNWGSATGFVFTCTGNIVLVMDFDAFSGNAHPFELSKQ